MKKVITLTATVYYYEEIELPEEDGTDEDDTDEEDCPTVDEQIEQAEDDFRRCLRKCGCEFDLEGCNIFDLQRFAAPVKRRGKWKATTAIKRYLKRDLRACGVDETVNEFVSELLIEWFNCHIAAKEDAKRSEEKRDLLLDAARNVKRKLIEFARAFDDRKYYKDITRLYLELHREMRKAGMFAKDFCW